MDYQERIIRDRQICGGQPVFKGTRVLLRNVLAGLAAGKQLMRSLQATRLLTQRTSKLQLPLLPRPLKKTFPFRQLRTCDENQVGRKRHDWALCRL